MYSETTNRFIQAPISATNSSGFIKNRSHTKPSILPKALKHNIFPKKYEISISNNIAYNKKNIYVHHLIIYNICNIKFVSF